MKKYRSFTRQKIAEHRNTVPSQALYACKDPRKGSIWGDGNAIESATGSIGPVHLPWPSISQNWEQYLDALPPPSSDPGEETPTWSDGAIQLHSGERSTCRFQSTNLTAGWVGTSLGRYGTATGRCFVHLAICPATFAGSREKESNTPMKMPDLKKSSLGYEVIMYLFAISRNSFAFPINHMCICCHMRNNSFPHATLRAPTTTVTVGNMGATTAMELKSSCENGCDGRRRAKIMKLCTISLSCIRYCD
jgi:hypothetical protein